MANNYRHLLTKDEFEKLRKTATKRELIEVLSKYVKVTDRGKPPIGERAMTGAERVRRHREKQRALNAGKLRKD